MTSTAVHSQLRNSPAGRRGHASPAKASRPRVAVRTQQPASRPRPIARYTDCDGRAREIVTRVGRAQSVLVVDRDEQSRGDDRLIAHLAPEEPPGNAAVAACGYVARARRCKCLCRRVCEADLTATAFVEETERPAIGPPIDEEQTDSLGRRYELARVETGMSIPELRWRRCAPGDHAHPTTISLREAIAGLESYEPVCARTERALRRHDSDDTVSTTALRGELQRVRQSPIVLNRGLREAVLAAMTQQGLSMSEIAIRCGRIKRDSAGNQSGETSWLARRLGLLPEGGRNAPTPWVHSDVLALIARDGLGQAPREVELD
jgi:hypothetical protein